MDWQQLSTTSHYETAVAIARELQAGNVQEASLGIQELIDAMARSERRALRSQLLRLMVPVLKWKAQPERRSGSWAVTIYQAREEIAAIQEEVPSLTRKVIEELWDRCFAAAKRQAQAEMNQKVEVAGLSWAEVFETDYTSEGTDGDANP
jgi:hypothetical protein